MANVAPDKWPNRSSSVNAKRFSLCEYSRYSFAGSTIIMATSADVSYHPRPIKKAAFSDRLLNTLSGLDAGSRESYMCARYAPPFQRPQLHSRARRVNRTARTERKRQDKFAANSLPSGDTSGRPGVVEWQQYSLARRRIRGARRISRSSKDRKSTRLNS